MYGTLPVELPSHSAKEEDKAANSKLQDKEKLIGVEK